MGVAPRTSRSYRTTNGRQLPTTFDKSSEASCKADLLQSGLKEPCFKYIGRPSCFRSCKSFPKGTKDPNNCQYGVSMVSRLGTVMMVLGIDTLYLGTWTLRAWILLVGLTSLPAVGTDLQPFMGRVYSQSKSDSSNHLSNKSANHADIYVMYIHIYTYIHVYVC